MIEILLIYFFGLLALFGLLFMSRIYRKKWHLRQFDREPDIVLNGLLVSPEVKKALGRIATRDPRSRYSGGIP